jgi:hypothetical protein
MPLADATLAAGPAYSGGQQHRSCRSWCCWFHIYARDGVTPPCEFEQSTDPVPVCHLPAARSAVPSIEGAACRRGGGVAAPDSAVRQPCCSSCRAGPGPVTESTPGKGGSRVVGVQVWGVGRFPTSADGACAADGVVPEGDKPDADTSRILQHEPDMIALSRCTVSQNLVPAYFEENN